MARLEQWSLVGVTGDKPLAIRGEIRGDERFADGTPITSSRLLFLDPDGRIASTGHHTYELGTISGSFARWMANHGRALGDYAAAVAAGTRPPAPAPVRPLSDITVLARAERSASRGMVQELTVRVAG